MKAPPNRLLIAGTVLDGIGAIGISRVFTFCGQNELTPSQAIEWYNKKIKKAIPLMQTETGKQQAKKELKYVYSFFERYKKESEETYPLSNT